MLTSKKEYNIGKKNIPKKGFFCKICSCLFNVVVVIFNSKTIRKTFLMIPLEHLAEVGR